MHAAERPQEGAQPRACAFTAVAVHFSHTIPIVIAGPLALRVIDRRMREIQSMVTAVLVRIDDRSITRDGFAQNALAGGLVTVADHPAALFTTLAADDMNDRWSVVIVGAVACLLVRAATRRIVHVGMRRTFFPRRSDKVHRPQRAVLPSQSWGRCRSDWIEAVAAGYALFDVRAGVHGPSAQSTRPC